MSEPDRFITTRWSLIEGLSDPAPEKARQALDELARIYRPCIYAHILRHVHRPEQADDLTQGFFGDVIVGRGLLNGVERKEPLRCLIYRAIRNYLTDDHRRQAARSPRDGARVVSIDGVAPVESEQVEEEFYRRWAGDVMNESLRRLRQYLEQRKMSAHWRLFEQWAILPQVRHAAPPPMAELAPRHGFASATAGSAAVQEARRRWEVIVREVLAETVEAGEVEEEFGLLRRVLA